MPNNGCQHTAARTLLHSCHDESCLRPTDDEFTTEKMDVNKWMSTLSMFNIYYLSYHGLPFDK